MLGSFFYSILRLKRLTTLAPKVFSGELPTSDLSKKCHIREKPLKYSAVYGFSTSLGAEDRASGFQFFPTLPGEKLSKVDTPSTRSKAGGVSLPRGRLKNGVCAVDPPEPPINVITGASGCGAWHILVRDCGNPVSN